MRCNFIKSLFLVIVRSPRYHKRASRVRNPARVQQVAQVFFWQNSNQVQSSDLSQCADDFLGIPTYVTPFHRWKGRNKKKWKYCISSTCCDKGENRNKSVLCSVQPCIPKELMHRARDLAQWHSTWLASARLWVGVPVQKKKKKKIGVLKLATKYSSEWKKKWRGGSR